ncbi:MAG: acyltransferase [Bacteroidaceae bacterium]|nr:acyltransferase [Bacteroidaceae bacterium]
MIFILLILIVLVCFGLRRADANESCLQKEHTDAVKGIFIIIVFYSHILPYLTDMGVSFSTVLDVPGNRIIKRMGQLMVVMFLFYSGYGVMESIQVKGKDYIRSIPSKRVLSTLVNYAIAIAVYLCMNLLLGIHYPVKQYALSLFAWESVGQSNWYIFAIICCYISTYFAFAVFRQKQTAFAGTAFLLLLYIIVLCRFKESWWYNIILSYPAGMAISMYKTRILSFLDRHYLITLSALILLFAILYHFRNTDAVHQATAVAFAYLVFVITYKLVIRNRALTWCGKNLFQLYVYQRIPMIALVTTCPEMVKNHPYLYVTACLAVTLLLAFMIKPISITIKNK